MNCDNSEEVFPVVDSAGKVVGRATRGECHGGSMLLHPVVHLHVFNSRGELYLQKRPLWKDIQPGRWDTAVGRVYGLHTARRSPKPCGARSARLGITEFTPGGLPSDFRSERERELVHVFRSGLRRSVRPSAANSTADASTVSQEIRENLGEGIFTPNFEGEVKLVLG